MCNCGNKKRAQNVAAQRNVGQPAPPLPGPTRNRSVPTPPPARTPTGRPPINGKVYVNIPFPNTRPIYRGKDIINYLRVEAPSDHYDTSLWGPSLWFILHTLAEFSDRSSARAAWTDLIKALQISIPCSECSAHFNQWVINHPFAFRGGDLRSYARQWVLDLHNAVNLRIGGDNRRAWTPEEVIATYGGDKSVRLSEIEQRIQTLSQYTSQGFIIYLRSFVRILN